MATTLTVQDAINFCSPFIKQQNLNVNNWEPGLSMARIISARILAPPFVWRFNRSHVSIAITQAGGTDYSEDLPDFDHVETQWLKEDLTSKIHELAGDLSLAKNDSVRRPTKFCPQYDDNEGNITFRFNSVPDKDYHAEIDYQRKAPYLASWGALWAPFPDNYMHIPFQGMLCWAGILFNDSRFPIWEKDFIASLLGAQDGLSDQAKAIFISDWMTLTRDVTRRQGMTQGGIAGRQT
jgi:hypothetical protein